MKKTGLSILITLWLFSTAVIGSNDSLDYYRIAASKYSELDQLVDQNTWAIQRTTTYPSLDQRESIYVNGFFLAQRGMQIVASKGLHTVVFQQTGDSATSFSTSLIQGMLEQLLKNSTSLEEVVKKFLSICEHGPTLYISGGEYIKFTLDYVPPIILSPADIGESPIITWYDLNGSQKQENSIPKGEILIKVSTFSSGTRKVEKIILN